MCPAPPGKIEESAKEQLRDALQRSISQLVRLDAAAVRIDFPHAFPGRRLAELLKAVIIMKLPTQDDAESLQDSLDWSSLPGEVNSTLQQNDNLRRFAASMSDEEIIATTTWDTVHCPLHAAIPTGVVVMQPEDCECRKGYGFEDGACKVCSVGRYKPRRENVVCTRCTGLKLTLIEGATQEEECTCPAGTYGSRGQHGEECLDCPAGSYCDGSGQKQECPSNSTTGSVRSSSIADCECRPGHQPSEHGPSGPCHPCEAGRYKDGVRNANCFLTCPPNANSTPASTDRSQCFCNEGYHAYLQAGQLDSCARCDYDGLICPGGVNVSGHHLQPRARKGWFQTGQTVAVQCLVMDAEGVSVCLGGNITENICAAGAQGWLCGECPAEWARGGYLDVCEPCNAGGAGSFALAALMDIARIAALNFGMAVISAPGATKMRPLHPAIIRIVQRWMDACSVLLSFVLLWLQSS